MTNLSYNEEQQRQSTLRHLFWPSGYGLLYESVLAVVVLVLFNLSTLSNDLLSKSFNTAHPLSAWDALIQKSLDSLQKYGGVQHIILFGMWALVGALIYILVFRTLQIFSGAHQSLEAGALLIRQNHTQGMLRWFAGLHDILLKTILFVAAALAIVFGVLVCFGIASQELNDGLLARFPEDVAPFTLSIIGALLSVRLIVVGLSLLSPRFRTWYTA